jgi:DNA-binding MarR family transcriptional regulator
MTTIVRRVGDPVTKARRTEAAQLATQVERLLTAGIGITARALDETPEAAELTLAQWRVLVVAAGTDGTRIGELARQLAVRVPSASRLVRRIEARQLVTATRDEADRRATLVELSDTGRRVFEAVIGRRRELIETALDLDQVERPVEAVLAVAEVADQLEAQV